MDADRRKPDRESDLADDAAGWVVLAVVGAAAAPILAAAAVAVWWWERHRWPAWTLSVAAAATTGLVVTTGSGPGYPAALRAVWEAAATPAPWPAWTTLAAQAVPVAAAGGLWVALPVVAWRHRHDQTSTTDAGGSPGPASRLRGLWSGWWLRRHPCTRPGALVVLHQRIEGGRDPDDDQEPASTAGPSTADSEEDGHVRAA